MGMLLSHGNPFYSENLPFKEDIVYTSEYHEKICQFLLLLFCIPYPNGKPHYVNPKLSQV